MGKYYFTEEQIVELKKNPYVQRVSEKAITYSQEFKEEYLALRSLGKGNREILRKLGFDPKILGNSRTNELSKRMKKLSLRVEGTTDLRKGNSGRPRLKERTLEEKISYLKHQLAYKEQEIAFLKKMNFLDRRAQWKKSAKEQ
jgi:transposase